MKINIPRVVRAIRLSDYESEFGEQEIGMWVNPPREKRLEFADIMERFKETVSQIEATEDPDELTGLAERIVEQGAEIHAWYADMWSQSSSYDEWTAEEVRALAEAALDTDPGLWDFIQESSLDAMQAYRRQKKAGMPGPQG